ncbi:MAG: tetratricopeptide repeat protein [Cyanobacteria bacterium REEB67]|nr:tetratricopeptide repeat protein [Cyanobacteria bacterium REEB67]
MTLISRLVFSSAFALFLAGFGPLSGTLSDQAVLAQERSQKLEDALHRSHAFAGSGALYSVQLIEKEGFVQVSNYPANPRKRIVDAIAAAKALINYSPSQFTVIAVRYLNLANSRYFVEVMVSARDITSLSVGTATLDDLVKNAQVVDVGPQDSATSILNKYLILAERQMFDSNFWEAEMIVDAGLRTVGSPSGEQSRLTQDMLTLAEGLDARGDFERAEKVLKRVLEVRAQNGRLDDADAERTIDHLTDLYISDKRYGDAQEMLNRLLANPSLSQINNPSAFANNLERLGICHFRNKQYDKALTEFVQVVALKRQQHGDNSPQLAMALEELGDTYRAQGQNSDAQANYKQAHAIYDHAVVSRSRADKMDYSIYYAHVKQLDDKLGARQQ